MLTLLFFLFLLEFNPMSQSLEAVDTTTGEVKFYIRRPLWRERVQTHILDESMTHQSHAESCDINAIIRRYERTGSLPPATKPPQYGDVTAMQGDLTERLVKAEEVINTSREHVKRKRKERQDSLPLEPSPAAPAAPVTPAPVAE